MGDVKPVAPRMIRASGDDHESSAPTLPGPEFCSNSESTFADSVRTSRASDSSYQNHSRALRKATLFIGTCLVPIACA
jgi:hypothetical protein